MADVISMPKLGFDMSEGTLIRWAIAEGDPVEKGQLLAEIETDKATVEVESLFSGTVRKHLVREGSIVPVNTPIAVIGEADEKIDFDTLVGASDTGDEPAPAAEEEAPEPASQPAVETADDGSLPDGVRATPLARRIAEDKGLDIKTIAGSGPGGRIVKSDVEAALAAGPAVPPAPVQPAAETPQPAPAPTGPALAPLMAAAVGETPADTRIPLSKLRQAIGRRMVDSKHNYPSFYVSYEYDMGPVMALRKQANQMLAGTGEKLSVNDFLVKAGADPAPVPQPECQAGWGRRAAVRPGECWQCRGGREWFADRGLPRCRPQVAAPDLFGGESKGRARARRQDPARRYLRFNLFDQQPGDVWHGEFHRHHQPARSGHPGGWGCQAGTGGGRRGTRGWLAYESDHLGGPPRQ